MLRAAVEAAQATRPGLLVLAVTVLTSLDDVELGKIGLRGGALDQVLRLAALAATTLAAKPGTGASRPQAISGAELRATEKEIAAIDRRLARLADQIAAKHRQLAEHDQSDHLGIARLTEELRELHDGVAQLESRWLELSEVLE